MATTMQKTRTALQMAILASLAVWAGCGPRPLQLSNTLEEPRVWPEPPEQPRIAYLGSVSGETDLEKPNSWFQGLGDLVFGAREIGVLISPYAVAVDPTGVMFVADSGGAAIHAFNLRTRDYHQFSALDGDDRLRQPVSLALCENQLYVVDSVRREVCVFSKKGKFRSAFGSEQFSRPSGIACRQSDGTIYVTDTANHAIYVFKRSGAFVTRIGSRGLGPGQFNFPTHLWLDQAGRLFVSDTLNYRIQVLREDGTFLRMFGQQGDRPGNFAHPCGVATDSLGNIYVTDRQYENVQIFSSDGRLLMAFGQEGQGPGEFWLPGGLCVDSRNRIYVADSFNKRIQVFELLEDAGR